jgi:NAD+ kinase
VTAAGRSATVLSHTRVHQTGPALRALLEAAQREGVTLRFDPDETAKYALQPGDGLALDAAVSDDVDLCVVLGGDGTILRALRRYAGRGVPVFAVNYGEVGFLATIDPESDGLGAHFARALAGDFERLTLPALALETPDGPHAAINDLSIHRRPGARVAQLAYAVHGEEVGSVRCDGIVVATPAGSTGYNLANGGPVMAWGVEGFVVSFIAPHSLTARSLVVAPDDLLSIHNRSEGAVDISLDGLPAGSIAAGAAITASFLREAAELAQVPGTSFYRRLRQKFGRLAS